MHASTPTTILSHWYYRIDVPDLASDEFYAAVTRVLFAQQLADTKWGRVQLSEGGMLSAKREYLEVKRKEHVFHVCAAPFGNGFFVSWWLGVIESGLGAALAGIPYIGGLVRLIGNIAKPMTYYRMDTALMFQSATHAAVLAAVDEMMNGKGVRALTDVERQPIMRDFFAHGG